MNTSGHLVQQNKLKTQHVLLKHEQKLYLTGWRRLKNTHIFTENNSIFFQFFKIIFKTNYL